MSAGMEYRVMVRNVQTPEWRDIHHIAHSTREAAEDHARDLRTFFDQKSYGHLMRIRVEARAGSDGEWQLASWADSPFGAVEAHYDTARGR